MCSNNGRVMNGYRDLVYICRVRWMARPWEIETATRPIHYGGHSSSTSNTVQPISETTCDAQFYRQSQGSSIKTKAK